MTTPAYDDWARYYDLGEGDRGGPLAFYSALLGPGTRRVLELGCGTGAILAPMRALQVERGLDPGELRFVGVDLSPRMLEVAKARDPTIEWVEGDLGRPPVEGSFDLVFCCVSTFQFMPTDDRLREAFSRVHRLCGEDACFAFDLYQPNLPYLRLPRHDTPTRRFTHDGSELEIREDSSYDEESRMLQLDWRLVEADSPSQVLAQARFRIRQFFPDDVAAWLREAGFEVIHCFGDFHRRTFDARSTRQVWVCRRQSPA